MTTNIPQFGLVENAHGPRIEGRQTVARPSAADLGVARRQHGHQSVVRKPAAHFSSMPPNRQTATATAQVTTNSATIP